MNESADLDFGIYRIFNYRKDKIEKELNEKVESAFEKHKTEQLKDIEQKFEEAKKKKMPPLNQKWTHLLRRAQYYT